MKRNLETIRIKDDHLRAALAGEEFLLIDGAMGTQMQKRGLAGIEPCTELLCKTHADDIAAIHRAYVEAGAEVITTNTFNARSAEAAGHMGIDEAFSCAAACARAAGARYVAGDIGPTGELLAPMGTLPFEDACAVFAREARAAQQAGCDLILIETMADLREAKAAVLAALDSTDLPVFVTMTFGKQDRTFLGTPPDAAAETLWSLGAHAVGINCSLGPCELGSAVRTMAARSHGPLIVQPNAGLPRTEGTEIFYDIAPDEFAEAMRPIVDAGASILGGCCGTSPDYTAKLSELIASYGKPLAHPVAPACAIASYQNVLSLEEGTREVIVVGTRCVASENDEVADAIADADFDVFADEAIDQEDEEAAALAVCARCDGTDEEGALRCAVDAMSQSVSLPLVVETGDAKALEAAVRPYSGKPLARCTAAGDALDALLGAASRCGCAVALAPCVEEGRAASVEDAVSAAERAVRAAESFGIARDDVVIDATPMCDAASASGAADAARFIALAKERLGVRTLMDVSGARFAEPSEALSGRAPLAVLLESGLDFALFDPASGAHAGIVDAQRDLIA